VFFLDDRLIWSASDLTAAAQCEFAVLRRLDAKLGRVPLVDDVDDAMLERAKRLGDRHEARELDRYRERFGVADDDTGRGVVSIDRPPLDREALEQAAERTRRALLGEADVVFQGTFFDGAFVGFADFLVRTGERVEVVDTKLARHAKVTALLQLAAYAEQLRQIGIDPGDRVHLLLGDGTTSTHKLADVVPVFRLRRARLAQIFEERLADTAPVDFGDPRYSVCGRCATCDREVEARRDLLLVAGMRTPQRTRLRAAGVTTIDELAASSGPVEGVGSAALTALRAQAVLQTTAAGGPLAYDVFDPAALEVVPPPDAGDIFFDFEGDPLYSERLGGRDQWNLDYLFGVVESDTGAFRPFWAHDFAEEREALLAFLAYVSERRRRHPDMHIYHYADYERAHLQAMTARHGVGEQQLDELLRRNTFVDLYPIVKKSVRVSSRSYGLKKLEPLYMGDDRRSSDVQDGGASVDAYVEYRRLRDAGDAVAAAAQLADIAEYNRDDCVSTGRLRDWLLARAAERGVAPLGVVDLAAEQVDDPPNPLRDELRALAGDPLDPARTPERTALALTAAALDFHRRERKTFWWEHFNRLFAPIEDWQDSRDVLVVESAVVERDWEPEGWRGTPTRRLLLRGRLAPGSRLRDSGVTLVYDRPGPFDIRGSERGARPANMRAAIVEVVDDGTLRVAERLPPEAHVEYAETPVAVTPGFPLRHDRQEAAIDEWARGVLAARTAPEPGWPGDPATDLVLRRAPRGAGLVPDTGEDRTGTIVESLRGLDGSYLAVQGPPGTGKTWLGSRVIARLVREHGWRVGVVAQSHAVVENMLARIVETGGLDRELVAKKVKPAEARNVAESDEQPPFTVVADSRLAEFAEQHPQGYVLGGTAWDFANETRFPRRSLDLLVVDEAGQFSLADTIACSVAARNLLLLGDPQQLPQVSLGLHPEPIDDSALGFIAAGHEVLPAQFGYFLAESWRMHPDVARAVSELSYEGRLRSHEECTAARRLDGVPAGLAPVPVPHTGNATASREEADEVVRLAAGLVGREWSAPETGRPPRPLEVEDLIVVAPYNAHVDLIREAADAAGLDRLRVGTVDRFQGQEAVVAILALAASSADDVPRGMSFLLKPNRLNVGISRAQWAAYLVHSPALVDTLPWRPEALAELSRFVTLVGADATADADYSARAMASTSSALLIRE
jgi:predicted RecB family nuclease